VTAVAETNETGGDATTRSARLRHLIITVYGLYARHDGGWLSVATLIRLLADLGIDEPAARSAISRLKRRGILQSRRYGGSAGYQLSAERAGDDRREDRHPAWPLRPQGLDQAAARPDPDWGAAHGACPLATAPLNRCLFLRCRRT
jgi:hypothetical protein